MRHNESLLAEFSMRILYTMLFYISLPFVLIRLFWRSRQNPAYKKRISERFGRYKEHNQQTATIWLHAVSLGEAIAASELIRQMQQKHSVVVTTMTPTGSRYIQKQFGNSVQHVYIPYDIGSAINAFLHRFQPKQLLIMETELWPNLIHCAKKKGLRVSIINGRLSDHSFRQYARFKFLTKKILKNIDWVGAKSKEDMQRFITLGAKAEKTSVIPNIKFSAALNKDVCSEVHAKTNTGNLDRPVWVAGSTHENEDEQVIDAHIRIQSEHPDALLIMVPRHLKRVEAIKKYAESRQLKVQCSKRDQLTSDTNIWLVDQMGVLQEYYKLAPIAFVGGSLVPIGGHNLLEPARAGAAVLSGPELGNFRQIRDDLLSFGGLSIIESGNALAEKVMFFLANPSNLLDMQQRGAELIHTKQSEALKPIMDWVNIENYAVN